MGGADGLALPAPATTTGGMKERLSRRLARWLGLFLGSSLGASAAATPVATLAEIEAVLQQHPPVLAASETRTGIAAALDRLVTVRVHDRMTDDDRARLQPLAEFYRRQVDRGLDALERTVVREGVHVFKFYSSSIVLKSAEGVVAIDFAQGPINNGGEPEQRDTRRTGFFLTPLQRDRLARLVDVSLITHRHHDHADYSLSRRLLAQGKAVVGPAQLRKLWKDLAPRLTVPDFTRPQRIGPVEFLAFRGLQCARNGSDATGERVGIPNPALPDADSETLVYLARVGGFVYLQAGENHLAGAGDWLREAASRGFAPELQGSTGQFQGARAVDAVLRTLPPRLLLPRHEYEMTHEGGGNRMSVNFTGSGARALAARQSLVLFWGEQCHVQRLDLPRR